MDEIRAAYTLCGPVLKAWPKVIDSYALARGKAELAGLSAMALPYGPYENREAFCHIEEFVLRGGLLICCDPEAFQTDEIGNKLPRERLLGTPRFRRSCLARRYLLP